MHKLEGNRHGRPVFISPFLRGYKKLLPFGGRLRGL